MIILLFFCLIFDSQSQQQADDRRVEHEVNGLEFKGLKQLITEASNGNQGNERLEKKVDILSEKV
jgi:hypothetical protein